jgi:predicted cupin superfamily sugar epimerase
MTSTAPTGSPTAIRRTVDGTFIEELVRPARAIELGLEPHPEGGWYRSTWTSTDTLSKTDADGTLRRRPAATLIVFLLPAGEASAWHRVSSSEIWITNGLAPITLELGGTGERPVTASSHVLSPHNPQLVIAAGEWQRTIPSDQDSLASCMVSPGFDFADFSLE